MNQAPTPTPTPQQPQEAASVWRRITGDIWAFSGGLWADVWNALSVSLPDLVGGVFDSIGGWFENRAGDVDQAFTNESDSWGEAATSIKAEIEKLMALPFPLDIISALGAWILGPITFVGARIQMAMMPALHEAAQETKSGIPDIGALATLWWKNPENRVQIQDWFEQNNMDAEARFFLTTAVRNYGDLGVIFDLRRRGIIESDEDAVVRIQTLGFSEGDAQGVLELRNIIPNISDLIRMAVREAFDPDAIERFKLDEAYPEELTPWAERQGLSEDWAKAYWRAHWDLPSVGQGFEMLWRTDFTEEDLDLLMRVADINPYFRPFLKEIAHRPYTRVDVRRMYGLHILDRNGVKTAYMDLGYDEEKAENMTEFTIRYENRSETQDLISKTLWSLKNGLMSQKEAGVYIEALLGDARTQPWVKTEADFLVKRQLTEMGLDLVNAEMARIKGLYTSRRIDLNGVSDLLDDMELDAVAKAELIAVWNQARKAKARYPTKKELQEYLIEGIIERDVWWAEMENLGYEGKYLEWYLTKMMMGKGIAYGEASAYAQAAGRTSTGSLGSYGR